ncbi:MAG: hypothetical protein GY906_16300 [bacterium]|nr:hypothetical protein [bacterium]
MEHSRVFVSDVHINAGRSLDPVDGKHTYDWLDKKGIDRFTAFLIHLAERDDVRDVVIIGDLFDNWVCPVDEVPPSFEEIVNAKCNAPLIEALRALCASDTIDVLYLPGNHDMGVSEEFVHDHFPKMIFGGAALYDSVYRTSRLRAEHGSAHAIFNAPDPINNPRTRIPLGYFISRVAATRMHRNGNGRRHFWTYIDDLLETLGPQTLPSSVFEAMLEEADLPGDTDILMPPVGGVESSIKADDVKTRYEDLYQQWVTHHGPGKAFKSLLAEISMLGRVADSLCKKSDTNIVVFGHSHDWKLDKDSWFVGDRVYANCGTWCDPDKPATFVETQKDNACREHNVRVMKWKKNKAVKLGSKSVTL